MSLLLAAGSGAPATLTADLAAVEAQDVAAFSTTLVHPVTFAIAEAADTAAFSAALVHAASFALTEAADIAAFSSALVHPASFAITEGVDLAAFDATLVQAEVPAVRVGAGGGARYMPSKAMEQYALAMKEDEELLLILPILVMAIEENRMRASR